MPISLVLGYADAISDFLRVEAAVPEPEKVRILVNGEHLLPLLHNLRRDLDR